MRAEHGGRIGWHIIYALVKDEKGCRITGIMVAMEIQGPTVVVGCGRWYRLFG
jgi:hypothetical protein